MTRCNGHDREVTDEDRMLAVRVDPDDLVAGRVRAGVLDRHRVGDLLSIRRRADRAARSQFLEDAAVTGMLAAVDRVELVL